MWLLHGMLRTIIHAQQANALTSNAYKNLLALANAPWQYVQRDGAMVVSNDVPELKGDFRKELLQALESVTSK